MTTKKIVLAALGAVLLLMALAAYLIRQPQDRIEANLANWIGSGSTTTQFDFTFEDVAKQMLRGTAYEGRINIDLPPRQGFVNLYAVLRQALEKDQPELVCGCAFVPKLGAVICDAEFLHEFSNSIESQSDPKDKQVAEVEQQINAWYRSFLFHWAIGHEIGHFMLAHGTKQSDGKDEQLQKPWGAQEEIDADVFMISRLGGDGQLQFNGFMALSQFVARQYGLLMNEQHPGVRANPIFGPFLDVDVYAARSSHPHWLVRAASLAQTLIKFYPKVEDTSGHFERVLAHVKQTASRNSVRNACTQFQGSGGPPNFNRTHLFIGEMELVERLANTGHVALAQRRLSSAVPLLPKDDASKSRRAYAALLEIWIAVVDRNTKAAEKLLTEAREQYGQTIENDASSMTLVLVSEARLAFLKNTTATDKARLEGIFEKTFKIVNEALAKTDADERQVLETMLVFWRASVDIYGPMSAEALSYIQQIAHRQVPPMVARELVDEWLALGPRIDSKLKAGDGGKADQLLFIRNFMDLSGDHVEALALGEIGLRYLDNTSADQIGLRAKYRIEIARDLIRTGEAARAVPLLREALEFRSQYFEQYKGADPAEKMRRLHQVAIAENELGFALQNNRAYEESTTHLKSATKILHENSIQDPDGVSAALQNLAVNCLALGNFEGARVVAAEALRIRELIEDKTGANDSRLSLAFALHYLKREAEARLLFDDWLREYEWTNDLTVDAQELYAVIDGKEVSLSTVVKLPDMKFPELTRLKTALKENSKKVRGQVKSEVGEGT